MRRGGLLTTPDNGCVSRPSLGPLDRSMYGSSMDRQEAAVRRYWTGFWSRGDPTAALEFYAPRFSINGAEETAEAFTSGSLAWRAHFSGFTATVEETIVCGDRVISRVTFRGTHQAGFKTVPATGRRIEVTGIDVFRFHDGRVVEHWHEADHSTMFAQLGATPRLDTAPPVGEALGPSAESS